MSELARPATPPAPTLPADAEAAVRAAIARHRDLPGPLLPILHAVQHALGHVPPAAVAPIADALNLSRAEVHGVISFYHWFRTKAPGRHTIHLCRAEACQAVGAVALERHVIERLGVDFHGTTADGRYTLEPVYCLGNCACGPSLLLDETLHANVTPESFDALVAHEPAPIPPKPAGAPGTNAARAAGAVRVHVPRDASARALGADEVAAAIAKEADERGLAIELVRTGSRGMFWLEPLIEVDGANGRIGYGPVRAGEVPSLFDADFLHGGQHAQALGPIEAHEYLRKQQRLCFARVGVIDPLDPEDYHAHGGWRGLERALAMSPAAIVAAVTESELRGRGGAAFPAGIKWQTALRAQAPRKYVVANADEGDSGTFADRMLMEGDPYALIEGMTIAALAVGAEQGYIYLRCEYPDAHRTLEDAIRIATERGYLGDDIRGCGRRFALEVRLGAGSYVCGEETAMLESLEGKRGQVRPKPPVPAERGLFGMPTVVNNVVTFVSVPAILEQGGAWYREFGVGRSRGTIPLQLGGNIMRGGLIEVPFGVTLREVLYDFGGGSRSARFRSAGRSARTCRHRNSTPPSTTRRSRGSARYSATAASWRSTTPSTWPRRPASPWTSARSSPAASARPAGSARYAAAK